MHTVHRKNLGGNYSLQFLLSGFVITSAAAAALTAFPLYDCSNRKERNYNNDPNDNIVFYTSLPFLQYKLNDESHNSTNYQSDSFANQAAFDVEPVIVIFVCHILRTLENESGVMTEPTDVQHNGIISIHNGPQQKIHNQSLL